ncbi:MAG TPA: hypothetical protein VMS17_04360 [Gemmataceae bacterium]|nr:hypothetical protein [Gemmataceae bacterium]
MMRRWLGAAVIAGCLGLAPAARAQNGPPPAAPGAMPDPIPFCPTQGPNMVPGPLSTATAPPGPCPDLSLPCGDPGAFPCEPCVTEEAVYFSIGAQALQRHKLSGDSPVAVLDPSLSKIDTGVPPPGNSPVVQQLGDITMPYAPGIRATLGYLWNRSEAVEVSGYYMFQDSRAVASVSPGRIDLPFSNPPLGFEGDNGLWLQADRTATTFATQLWTVEANYRYSDVAVTGAEFLFGARYFDLKEKLSNLTDDDGISFPLANGQPDPTRIATYFVQTENRLVAPQLGIEWQKTLVKWLDLGFSAKGAWGADFVTLNRSLVRGDGFRGFAGVNNEVQFAQMYEVNGFVDFRVLERLNLRLGYNCTWMLDMANVEDQLDFKLQNVNNINNRNGNVFFQGPVAELQFLF